MTVLVCSCVDDDVCDKPVTPRLTIDFIDGSADPFVVDSLFVDKVNTDGSVSQEGLFLGENSIRIPLNTLSDQTILHLYTSNQTSDADKDIITIKYNTEQKFISKACGFKVIFSNVTYELTRQKEIVNIIPNTTEIQDESKNLFIAY